MIGVWEEVTGRDEDDEEEEDEDENDEEEEDTSGTVTTGVCNDTEVEVEGRLSAEDDTGRDDEVAEEVVTSSVTEISSLLAMI